MSERNGSTSAGTGTAEIPVVRRPSRPAAPAPGARAPAAGAAGARRGDGPGADEATWSRAMQPTAPVTVRPRPADAPARAADRDGPLGARGRWTARAWCSASSPPCSWPAPQTTFEDRFALVFLVLGLGMLGTSGSCSPTRCG